MRMKLKIFPPGVQYGEETDLSPQVAGIGGDDLQGFGSGLKKKAIDDSFVLVAMEAICSGKVNTT